MSIAANRHHGIRAALCHDAYTAAVAQDTMMQMSCVTVSVLWVKGLESILDAWITENLKVGDHGRSR